jgi:ATP-dependent RNA helicase DeaD
VLKALEDVGYESPSPIQAETIPYLLAGRDLVGQAQTGTGKTAAFALPILSQLNPGTAGVQTLVLAPTRELAIQVAEAFQKYAKHMPGFHVLPIYGGQSYEPQLASLRRGVHVVVGTPGRVMDHMKRGTLKLDSLRYLVLDEADEMLRMGFIDDVDWILGQTPPNRQVALFSATMPAPIRKIAQRHLKSPAEVTIRSKTSTATNIRQRYFLLGGMTKLDALTRILEAEPFDGMLVFARTKQSTAELAERLEARGYAAAALNGDIPQNLRERTVQRLKNGQLDIVVATDVAARGLDVDRISHVVNFDIPYDTESYVHRIGRTGRASRSGDAILFVTYRERNMLRLIERATRQPITQMELPSLEAVSDLRIARFMQKVTDARAGEGLVDYQQLVERYALENDVPVLEVAGALAKMAQGDKPLFLESQRSAPRRDDRRDERREEPVRAPAPMPAHAAPVQFVQPHADADEAPPAREPRPERAARPEREPRAPREHKPAFERPRPVERAEPRAVPQPVDVRPESRPFKRAEARPEVRPEEQEERPTERRRPKPGEPRMETYRVAVGKIHRVKPANIVGAIINEAGLDGKMIGHIDIQEDHSLVDLPEGMPKEIFRDLQKVWVAGQQLKITKVGGDARAATPERAAPKSERPLHTLLPSERPLRKPGDKPFRKTLGKSFDRPVAKKIFAKRPPRKD